MGRKKKGNQIKKSRKKELKKSG